MFNEPISAFGDVLSDILVFGLKWFSWIVLLVLTRLLLGTDLVLFPHTFSLLDVLNLKILIELGLVAEGDWPSVTESVPECLCFGSVLAVHGIVNINKFYGSKFICARALKVAPAIVVGMEAPESNLSCCKQTFAKVLLHFRIIFSPLQPVGLGLQLSQLPPGCLNTPSFIN